MIGTLIYWALGIAIVIIIFSVAYSYIPDGFKKWVKNIIKKDGDKKNE